MTKYNINHFNCDLKKLKISRNTNNEKYGTITQICIIDLSITNPNENVKIIEVNIATK